MTYTAIVTCNNYKIGSPYYRATPTHKATTERVDSKHTLVTYKGLTKSELTLVIKALGRSVEWTEEPAV